MQIRRRGPRLPAPKLIGAAVLLAVFVLVAFFVPHPDVQQLRDWAAGPWLPLAFFAAHALVTVVFPRMPFTLGAGFLFGPVIGVALSISATTVSAALAFLLARALGRDAIASRLTHPAISAVDRRLARRGWLAVGSLRLIGPVPFPLINFCAGVSSIRLAPFLLATAVGLLPGTVSVVILGDALTGDVDPTLVVISVIFAVLGLAGLLLDARLGVRSSETPPQSHATATDEEPSGSTLPTPLKSQT
ncbi:TVP38/TMEM64 family protein [Nonomuraea longicatena]|uniref:TVP38/TMEM64 family membrane protein n=1 Tax=Nonomuraea longicatena TaxID=83682 RepID=A0ABN1Q4G7_9ACTN